MSLLAHWYAPDLPWRPVSPLVDMLATQPTLVFGELAFIGLAAVALLHACRNGQHHLLLWFGALVGGTANDVFFMALPFVDNFWHAQCAIMLTPRLPLYILCVYIAFIYVPVAASWRLKAPPLARFVAAAFTAGLLYAPFDVTGAKFLWWTWHDTDAAVAERWLGVPIGSTMFTIMHTFCFHALLHACALTAPTLSAVRFAGSLIFISLLGTPMMMMALSPCQILQLRIENGVATQLPGRPDGAAFALEVALLASIGLASFRRRGAVAPPRFLRSATSRRGMDAALWRATCCYFLTLASAMALGEPASVVAEGVHQEIGRCYVHDFDLSNYSRFKYLCQADFDEDFHFGCAPKQSLPPPQPSWYTLCGKAHSNYAKWLLTVIALGVVASLSLGGMMFGGSAVARRKSVDTRAKSTPTAAPRASSRSPGRSTLSPSKSKSARKSPKSARKSSVEAFDHAGAYWSTTKAKRA